MLGGTVNVTIAGGNVGNVYGGGYRGSIGDTGANQQVTVNVTILGGEIFQNVYGGGSGGLDKVKHNSNGTMSTQTTSYYTQSMGQSYVYGDINLTIGGNAVIHGNVYGGGMSVPKLSSYDGILKTGIVSETGNVVATVYGNTSVTIQGHAKIDGSVFGAGRGVEVTYNMNTGTYEYPDQTRLYVVDMTNLSSANPFKTIPWLLNSSGQVVYEYDSALCHVENNDAYIAEGCRYVTFARITGNSSINIDLESDGYIAQEVYGGSAYGKVTGNTSVKVVKGDLKKDVFGGGLGREGIVSVSGGRTVYIAGDENVSDTENSISGVSIKGSVYGGSSKGDDGGSTLSQYTNTVVIIRNGYIAKDIFGGGLMGNTYGNASVYVGYDNGPSGPTPYSYTEAHSHGISVDNIYAGGNVSTEYDSEGKPIGIVPFEKYLVKGSGTVIVFGDDGKRPISITGSVMGSGNSCLTADKSISSSFTIYLAINGVENRAESMSAIHRADELIITHSVLKITGRSPLVKVGSSEKTLSIYGIGTMTLRRDSIVSIEDPIDAVAQYRSLSKDNLPSTVAAPSNEIRFLTGSTFYVRDVNMVYGKVEGYTILSVETQGRYGAYVLGDALLSSNNGFVVYRDGSYERADYSDSSGIRCWFISGVTRKVLTMNLNAETDQQGHPILTNTMATVDIQKFQDATQLRFTGGSFTSMSSDGAKMYYFDRPGTVSDTYTNLGMIVGYAPEDPSYNPDRALLYDRDTRYLDIGEGSTWMYGSYYDENGDTYSEEPLRGYEDRPDRVSRTLTPVTLQAFRASETPAGIYGINFVFTATHSDRTSYLGYLVINLQESIVVTYESMEGGQSVTKENVMTTNRTEVRIDLYVIGSSGSATSANDYEVIMKTELPNNKSEGQCDIMIPTGFTNGELHITGVTYTKYPGDEESVFQRSYNRDAKIYVAAISNQDKTTGWSTSAGVVESNDTMSDTVVGTLMGNISATVRYYVRDFTYEEDYPDYLSPQIHSETKRPQFTLHFYVLMNGERVNSNVTVTLIEKQKFQVTFYDSYKDPDYLSPEVRGYYEGTELTESNMPSTGPNFIGWYYAGTNFSNVYDYGQPVTKDMSLEARYTYVLTFDNMDGTSYTMYVPAEEGGTMLNKNAVPRPTATGYEFVEWFTDQDCSRQWDYTMDRITGDTTLYAKWVGKQITVHFWYTDSSGNLVSFAGDTSHVAPEVIDGNSFYVMMRVGDELIRPYVRYGSTFNTIDPYQSSSSIINILDFAKQSIEATMGANVKFICWQAYRYNDPSEKTVYSIYSDTLMSGDMALERPTPGGSPTVLDVIDLYAVTATVAIQLEMSDSNNDASVHIAAPSTFLVYPDVPDDINDAYDVYGYDNTIYVFLNSNTVKKWMENQQKWLDSVTDPSTIRNNGTFLFKWSNDFNGIEEEYGGSFRYYLDADNNWYAVEDWNYKYIDDSDSDTICAHDKYGNFYTKTGNGAWTKSYFIVYAMDSTIEKEYMCKGSSWYVLDGDLWVSCSAPADYYYKDRFGNHYAIAWSGSWTFVDGKNNTRTYTATHDNGDTTTDTFTITISKDTTGTYANKTMPPVYSPGNWYTKDWSDDHFLDLFGSRFMRTGDIYKCTYGAEAFYEFTFQLNQATRAGYRLVGWHNQHVDPMDDSYPSAGVNRTLFVFVDLTETNQPVWREILRTTEGSLYQTWVYDGVSAQPVIGDPSHLYTVGYTAVWEQLNYTVNIGNPAHGTINAYLVNEDGSRTKIDGSIDNIHYGDRIELSYAPTGNYQFSRWMITGEYVINPVGRPSTTMIVQGDCTISVSDIGDRVVTAQVYYDGLREQGGGKLNGSDADRTTAFMLNKATGEYCQMDFIPNVSDEYEFYRGYVPLGEYVFVLRYDMGEYGHNDFELMGDLTVDIDGRVDFSFYVLTARITDATTDGSTVVDRCSIPEGGQIINRVLLVDEHGNEVLRVSKYTGAIKDYIDREIDQGGAIINNPEDMIPPVRFTVAPGYFFNIYEGFPDEVSGVDQFVVNDINRYPYGTTLYGESFSGRFDLNWTRYWKPADVVVHIAPIEPEVKFAVDSPGAGEDWTATENIPYGSAYGLDAMTSELETYLSDHSIFKHVSSWKYPDGRMAVTADVFGPETAVRLGLGGTPVIDGTTLEDQYGNKYTSVSVSDLDYYIVYKTVNAVESKYKIDGSDYYIWVNDQWESCDPVNLYYFKDGGNKYVLQGGEYRCFYIADSYCEIDAVITAAEEKPIAVKVMTENLSGGYDVISSVNSFMLTEDSSTYTGTFPVEDISGYSFGTVVLENAGGITVTSSAVIVDGHITGVLMTLDGWTDGITADIRFDLNTADLVWNKVWESDPTAGETPKVTANGWTYDSVTHKMTKSGVKYGQKVLMPYMNYPETDIVGWTVGGNAVGEYEDDMYKLTYTGSVPHFKMWNGSEWVDCDEIEGYHFHIYVDGAYLHDSQFVLSNGVFVRVGEGPVPPDTYTLVESGEYEGKYVDTFGNYWNDSQGNSLYEYHVFRKNPLRFTYAIEPSDSGTVSLDAVYHVDNVDITFTTFKSKFISTGYQSMTFSIPQGSALTVEQIAQLALELTTDGKYNGSKFLGWWNGDHQFDVKEVTSIPVTVSSTSTDDAISADVGPVSESQKVGLASGSPFTFTVTVRGMSTSSIDDVVLEITGLPDGVTYETVWVSGTTNTVLSVTVTGEVEFGTKLTVYVSTSGPGEIFNEDTTFLAKWEIIYLDFLFGQDMDYTEIDATVTASSGDNSVTVAQGAVGTPRNVGIASGDPFAFDITVTGMESKAKEDICLYISGLPLGVTYDFEVTSSLGADDTVLRITVTCTVAAGTELKIWVSAATAGVDVSATQDSSVDILSYGEPNRVLYNSEIIMTIRPPSGKTIDYEATIAASTTGYNFGQPKKLSEDRGFRWSFLLTQDNVVLNVKYKDISVKIDFYVNGVFVDPTGDHKVRVYSEDLSYDAFGQDIPMYKQVKFSNYGDKGVIWYIDPECTVPFDSSSTSGDYTYTQLMTESFSLYTYDRYVIVFHDSDGTGAYKIIREPVDGSVELPLFGYDMDVKHKDHLLAGWAVLSGDKHVYTYFPQGSVPTTDFPADKWLDLYAYYLTDGTYVGTFNGGDHNPRIYNDDTVQTDIAHLTVVYSDTVEFDPDQTYTAESPGCTGNYTIRHHTDETQRVHYWCRITVGGEYYTMVGTFSVDINTLQMFVIAPSAYKMHDGTALELGDPASSIQMRSIDGTVLPATILDCFSSVAYNTSEGYCSSLTYIGTFKTGASLTTAEGVDLTDFTIKYIDGTITVYSEESVRSETRGW